jgi:hypothetical protein
VEDMVIPVGREPEIILNTITGATGWKIGPKFKFGTVASRIGPKLKFCVLGDVIDPKFKFRVDGVEIDPKFIVANCRIDPKFKFCVLGDTIVPMLTTGITGPVKLDTATSWMLIGLPSIHGAKLLAVDHVIVIDILFLKCRMEQSCMRQEGISYH